MNAILAVSDGLLAAVDGSGFLRQAFVIFIILVCALIVWWLGRTFFPKLSAPAVVTTVWDGLFILLGAIAVINFLLSLVGKGFIDW